MTKGSSVWKSKFFDEERHLRDKNLIVGPYVRRADGWIMFGPTDIRSGRQKYRFDLQRLHCDKQLRVRVGCRYFTLAQAYNHWGPAKQRRCYSASRRNECKQALAIIELMLITAQAHGLISVYSKTPQLKPKPKKRK